MGFTDALLKEIDLQKGFFGDGAVASSRQRLDSIYFGGGTPSLLPVGELERVFSKLSEDFVFDEQTEITLEANPDDLTREKLTELRHTPLNRLSIGIQSFHEADLCYMNRVHSPAQALQSIEGSLSAGFETLTVDLIYGTPTLSDAHWQSNLERVIALGVPHISAYALTVEKKTALDVMIRRGRATAVDEDQTARQFDIMTSVLEGYGYEHYEISNFGKPGHHSRHNLSYWSGKPYLGLGPSAHSFRKGQRWWNASNMGVYMTSVGQGKVPSETEVLTLQQQFDEYVMTSLRTMWGCDLGLVAETWGSERVSIMLEEAQSYLDRGWLTCDGHKLKLNSKGKLFADRVASDLFWI